MKRKITESKAKKVNKTTKPKPKTKTKSRPKSKPRNTRQKESINKKAKNKSNQKRKAPRRQESAYKVKYHEPSKHLHIIVKEPDYDSYLSVGITHASRKGHRNNIELSRPLDKDDPKTAYIVNRPTIDRKVKYRRSKKHLFIYNKDVPSIEKVASRKPQDMRKKK